MKQSKKAFICYLDDNDFEVRGYFEIIQKSENYVKFKSKGNIITIPYIRVKKIKEELC